MLDPKLIREHSDLVRLAAKNKNKDPQIVDKWLGTDDLFRKTLREVEDLRAKQNIISKKFARESENKKQHLDEATKLKSTLKEFEEKLNHLEEKLQNLSLQLPNVPDPEVPIGKDESQNQVLRTWGEVPNFSFKPRDHITLATDLDLVDFERAAKVSGFRGYFLKNDLALMELALMNYALSKLTAKGYVPIIAPILVKEFTLFGTGQYPWGRQEVYSIPEDQLFLAGTAEIPVTAYYADEILEEKSLPKKFVAYSPCFRREAGSYGKDTKGLYRLHQFNKIEQVIICRNDKSESKRWHEELLGNAEELLQELKLPYRIVLMCTGDMGEPQVKKYDIETYMPGRGGYGETQSDSIMGDFQARRLNIRYRRADGSISFAHTLNNTAIASPRILIAILENYQQEDGSIMVPEVLRLYLQKDIIKKRPQ